MYVYDNQKITKYPDQKCRGQELELVTMRLNLHYRYNDDIEVGIVLISTTPPINSCEPSPCF